MKIRARLFTSQTLSDGLSLEPEDNVLHYLTSVMRLKSEEYVAVFNGRDGEWLAKYHSLSRKKGWLELQSLLRSQPPSPPALTLYFAPLKKTPLDFLIQKGTELGVTHFQPVITQYTQNENIKIERLKAQIIEASEQCRRLDIPSIAQPITFAELMKSITRESPLFYGDEQGYGSPIQNILTEQKSGDIRFLVGPEGGFSTEEFAILRHNAYIKAFSLGAHILRAETAAIAAIVASRLYLKHWEDTPLTENKDSH